MKSEKELIASGFISHKPHIDYSKSFLQKRVKSEDGTTLYFINIERFEFPSQDKNITSYSCSARLYTKSCNSFGIEIQIDPKEVEDVEVFFADIYIRLDCIPDPHNS